jgi:hypothetical protein
MGYTFGMAERHHVFRLVACDSSERNDQSRTALAKNKRLALSQQTTNNKGYEATGAV